MAESDRHQTHGGSLDDRLERIEASLDDIRTKLETAAETRGANEVRLSHVERLVYGALALIGAEMVAVVVGVIVWAVGKGAHS
jgi:hypothetical protein